MDHADGLKDPRDKEEGDGLSNLLGRIQISDKTLDNEEAYLFLTACVRNDYDACKDMLETSKQEETLVKGRESCSGKTALSQVCEKGHLKIAKLLCDHGAELDSMDKSGQTPLMLATLPAMVMAKRQSI